MKCAQLLTTTPGGEDYLVKLLQNTREDIPNDVYYQQVSAIKCMLLVNQKFAVRVLCSGLVDNESGGRAASTLALMGLPDAPYSTKEEMAPSKLDGIAKWKLWWEAHKDNYAGK